MSFVRDALSWVDSGAVQYPALHKKIVELTMPSLVVKKLFPEFPLQARQLHSLSSLVVDQQR